MDMLNPISCICGVHSLYLAYTIFLVDVLGLSLVYFFETKFNLVYTRVTCPTGLYLSYEHL